MACIGHLGLLAIFLLVFVGMMIQAGITGPNPSPMWFLVESCLLMLLGLHTIYFRIELAEIAREWPPYCLRTNMIRWAGAWPGLLVPTGLFMVLVGVVGVIKVLLSL